MHIRIQRYNSTQGLRSSFFIHTLLIKNIRIPQSPMVRHKTIPLFMLMHAYTSNGAFATCSSVTVGVGTPFSPVVNPEGGGFVALRGLYVNLVNHSEYLKK